MKFSYLTYIFLLLASLTARAVPVAQVENVHVADRTKFVTDMGGMLSPQARTAVDSIMSSVWQQTSAEPVVVIVDNLDGEDIDDYATKLFELWKPGKKDRDNGLILLISRDDRKFAIRTGYGTEPIVTDAASWSILNNTLAPHFRAGDYDTGVLEAARELHALLTDPVAREELQSRYANDAGEFRDSDMPSGKDLFRSYLLSWCFASLVAFIAFLILSAKSRREDSVVAYHRFDQWKLPLLMGSFASLGIMLPVWLLWIWRMRRIRNKPHICTNCGAKMKKLDEETDNLYLTPAQDAEERLLSVDYDVWLCPDCNQTEIIPFINKRKNYSVCPHCGARTSALVSNRVVRQPSTSSFGQGVRTYHCYNCNHNTNLPYQIPKIVAPPVIIGGGGGRGFGGGGFSGGSFGGGMTGGGGSSGGW